MTCLRAALPFVSIVATLPPMVLLGHDTPVVTVSSASFEQGAPVAPDSIASGFGDELATATESATSVPLPSDIAGTTVVVTDSGGVKRPAALFFVSPRQVNFLIPAGTATGPATLTVTSGDGEVSTGSVEIAAVSPALFTANATGGVVAAASVLRVAADGSRTVEPVARFDPQQGVFVASAIDLGSDTDQVFLVLFGTGVRHVKKLGDVTAQIDGVPVAVQYAGGQGEFEGLDQVNLGPLPRVLSGRGEVSVELTAGGSAANTASMSLAGPAVEFVTFNNQIVRIFQQRCQTCHHPGEVAPFSLMTYQDARPYALAIRANTQSRYMPPWKPVPGIGEFQGERRLTQREIDLIARWVEAGAPEGDPNDLPEPLRFSDQWTLGQPDLVTAVETPFTPDPFAVDAYRCFSMPAGLTEAARMGAIEIHPGNRKIVHHILLFADPLGVSAALDQADPGVGYSCFGDPGFEVSKVYGGWAPGGRPIVLPEGVALSIGAGARVVMQVHYHPDGTWQSDQTRVGFFLTDDPAPKEMFIGALANESFLIPAGAKDYPVTVVDNLQIRAGLLNVLPHMHLLGREIKLELIQPDGEVEPLIYIDDWDFDWQDAYFFQESVSVRPGSSLKLTCRFDNSEDNPKNPSRPPKPVRYGEGTNDEMCLAIVGLVFE